MDPGSQNVKLPDTIDKDEVDDLDDPPSSVCYFIIQGNEEGYFVLHPESHILMVDKELDRELKANHTLYIRATENCAERSFNWNVASRRIDDNSHIMSMGNRRLLNSEITSKESELYLEDEVIMLDSTVVRVLVRVLDVNDNPPKFRSKIFTGGFTTSADFGTKFMKLEAYDPDDGKNAVISYYQVGEIKQTLSEGLENVERFPFVVDRETGDIQLNFDPQKGMKGYFDFMVVANDTDGLQDSARVYIYLLREDQKVRFVFRLQPFELRERIHKFKETMSNVTKAIVNIDEYKVHENKDGSVDKTKTDLYMHLVDRDDNSIFEVTEVLRLIDQHIESLDALFKEFNVLDTQPAEAQLLIAGQARAPLFVWFVFSNLFLATLLVVTLALCASQRSGYKRQLRAAKVNIFHRSSMLNIPDGPEPPSTTVPNTNKHSVEGSNPIWLKGYENEWFKNDDNQSQGGEDSLDDNFLSIERQNSFNQHCKIFEQTNDLNRHFNVYQQIDKLTNNNAHMLVKKLETTEL